MLKKFILKLNARRLKALISSAFISALRRLHKKREIIPSEWVKNNFSYTFYSKHYPSNIMLLSKPQIPLWSLILFRNFIISFDCNFNSYIFSHKYNEKANVKC